jgi:hypothetical protein
VLGTPTKKKTPAARATTGAAAATSSSSASASSFGPSLAAYIHPGDTVKKVVLNKWNNLIFLN